MDDPICLSCGLARSKHAGGDFPVPAPCGFTQTDPVFESEDSEFFQPLMEPQ
jgi:hypothetical protein